MIKNQHHQREIEAKLEKGIINNDSKSIYSTGLTLQNKLIDDEKLMLFLKDQFANDSNTNINDNYQALIAKIRNNPKLLFEIIPSSKEKIDEKVKMQEKIKKSKILAQRAMKLKQKIRYFTNILKLWYFLGREIAALGLQCQECHQELKMIILFKMYLNIDR